MTHISRAMNEGTKESPIVGEYYGPMYFCSNCNFGKREKNEESFIIKGFKYCPNCGSRLVWEME